MKRLSRSPTTSGSKFKDALKKFTVNKEERRKSYQSLSSRDSTIRFATNEEKLKIADTPRDLAKGSFKADLKRGKSRRNSTLSIKDIKISVPINLMDFDEFKDNYNQSFTPLSPFNGFIGDSLIPEPPVYHSPAASPNTVESEISLNPTIESSSIIEESFIDAPVNLTIALNRKNRLNKSLLDSKCCFCDENLKDTVKFSERIIELQCTHVCHQDCYVEFMDLDQNPTSEAQTLMQTEGNNYSLDDMLPTCPICESKAQPVDLDLLGSIFNGYFVQTNLKEKNLKLTKIEEETDDVPAFKDANDLNYDHNIQRFSTSTEVSDDAISINSMRSQEHDNTVGYDTSNTTPHNSYLQSVTPLTTPDKHYTLQSVTPPTTPQLSSQGLFNSLLTKSMLPINKENSSPTSSLELRSRNHRPIIKPRALFSLEPPRVSTLLEFPSITIPEIISNTNKSKDYDISCLITVQPSENFYNNDNEEQTKASKQLHKISEKILNNLNIQLSQTTTLNFDLKNFGDIKLVDKMLISLDLHQWHYVSTYLFDNLLICVDSRNDGDYQEFHLRGSVDIKDLASVTKVKYEEKEEDINNNEILSLNLTVPEIPILYLNFFTNHNEFILNKWEKVLKDKSFRVPFNQITNNLKEEFSEITEFNINYENDNVLKNGSSTDNNPLSSNKYLENSLFNYSTFNKIQPAIDLVIAFPLWGSNQRQFASLKSTIRSILKYMNPNDRLGIIFLGGKESTTTSVSFISTVESDWCGWETVLDDLKSNDKDISKRSKNELLGCLKCTLNILQFRSEKNPITSLFLFYDCEEDNSISDLKFQSLKEEFNERNISIQMFGIGPNHHISSLSDLTEKNNRNSYTYLPTWDNLEISTIGALKMQQSHTHNNFRIKLQPKNDLGVKIQNISINNEGNYDSEKNQIILGDLQAGISKSFVVHISVPENDLFKFKHESNEHNEQDLELFDIDAIYSGFTPKEKRRSKQLNRKSNSKLKKNIDEKDDEETFQLFPIPSPSVRINTSTSNLEKPMGELFDPLIDEVNSLLTGATTPIPHCNSDLNIININERLIYTQNNHSITSSVYSESLSNTDNKIQDKEDKISNPLVIEKMLELLVLNSLKFIQNSIEKHEFSLAAEELKNILTYINDSESKNPYYDNEESESKEKRTLLINGLKEMLTDLESDINIANLKGSKELTKFQGDLYRRLIDSIGTITKENSICLRNGLENGYSGNHVELKELWESSARKGKYNVI